MLRGAKRNWRSGGKLRPKLAAASAVATTGMLAGVLVGSTPASAAVTSLARYPYLTDVTTSSVQVNWADTYFSTKGKVGWGTADANGACSLTNSVVATAAGRQYTIAAKSEYQHSLTITGLAANTSYCYRIFGGNSANSIDLLAPDASPVFRTLPSSGSYSFLVFGDWGDNSTSTTASGQAKLDALIASSGASFAVGTGDIAYNTGTQTEYGDLISSGTRVSQVFGANYWKAPGAKLPFFTTAGNHGRTSTFFQNWPEPTVVAASNGTYSLVDYSSVDGNNVSKGPGVWYAFDVAGVRNYVLTADWSDTNVGQATGDLCTKQFAGHTCPEYQVEAGSEWAQNSAQYQWLKNDLATHGSQLKFAYFHYPLRSDDATESSDIYLQNSVQNPNREASLEKLLSDGGVKLAFNGHAHIYQRNLAPPGGVVSYVTGGGGAKLVPIAKSSTVNCATTDAYGLGWSESSNSGSYCGAAGTKPATATQVYHFLKITVNGSSVTVTPTNADGGTFDAKTYNFGADSSAPTPSSSVTATYQSAAPAKAVVTWTAGSDNGSGVSAYDVYRLDPGVTSRTYLATVGPDKNTYSDPTAQAGTSYTYSVDTRDQAGNIATQTAQPLGGSAPAPSAPTGLSAGTPSATSVALSWVANQQSEGVSGYNLYRDNTIVNGTTPLTTTSYTDSGLTPATPYSYTVQAVNAAGQVSQPSSALSVKTASTAGTSVPSPPTGVKAGTTTTTSVALSWNANAQAEQVSGYNVYRDGALLNGASAVNGTSYTDTGLTPAMSYTYTVRAVNSAGPSAPSSEVDVRTPAASDTTIVADAYVESDKATQNFGGDPQLRVNASSSTTMFSYLKFSLPDHSGTTVTAKLRFLSNSTGNTVTKVSAVSDNTWAESTVTYGSRPSIGAALGSTGALTAGTWAEATVTFSVDGQGLASFALSTGATATRYAASRESGNAPQLVVLGAG